MNRTTLITGPQVLLVLSGVALLMAACGGPPVHRFDVAGRSYDSEHATHLSLPKPLREVSGLTAAQSGLVYAHNDEKGIVYVIDYTAPRLVATMPLAGRLRADLEGIATLGARLFLVASTGTLYETRVEAGEEPLPATRHAGGLDCEVEGLTAAADGARLLAACKNLPADGTDITVYAWHPETASYGASPALSVPLARVQQFLAERFPEISVPKKIQPTGIETTATGNLLILAGRQHLLLEFTPEGTPVAAAALDPAVQRQAEGIALTADGRLLVASEGDGKGEKKTAGVLSIYEPIH
ncbi:MAG TPA: hypothetical protein VIS76_16465 [Pseudomonadales bacterium]